MSTNKNCPIITDEIAIRLKGTPERQTIVGPLVQHLTTLGWSIEQMVFGKKEWRIPRSPSEATRREKGARYPGSPVDIAVFDSPESCGDPAHMLFLIECKRESEQAGVSQLEAYFVGEPHARLGICRMLDIQQSDMVIDPACGTGGFLVQSMIEMQMKFPKMGEANLTRWAQTHLYGIEKDAVGLKLAKAIMQIAGDGSAHCARGDSVRTHLGRKVPAPSIDD